MTEDYWIAEILSVNLKGDQLVIRLERDEMIDADKPVTQFLLRGESFSPDALALLRDNLFHEVEIYFQEANGQKHLEVSFDHFGNVEARLEYTECERENTPYTFDELAARIKHIKKSYEAQIDVYWKESKRLRGMLHRLRQELGKEKVRLERKKEFFSSTEKGRLFDERLQCYMRVLDWMDRFEKDDAA